MKQRARPMQGGDDLVAYAMGKKADDLADHTEIQLHRIKPLDHFIEAQVQEGDSLQAIALRFYCSISELKRINHIHKDNEIFARRTIKVPVTPYSVLTELIPTQNPELMASTSNSSSHTVIQELSNTINNEPINQNNVSIPPKEGVECSIDCNTVVMNSTLAPSVAPYTDSEQNEQLLATEDTQLLPSNKEKMSVESVVVKELTSHGADFGLKWFHLVCCMLILGVVIPLVYVMFYLDKHEHSEISDLPPLHSNR